MAKSECQRIECISEVRQTFKLRYISLFLRGPDFFDRLARETLGAFWRLLPITEDDEEWIDDDSNPFLDDHLQ